MGIREKAKFVLEKDKCVKCGKCINTCSGMVLEFGKDGYPYMKDFERFGWRGCWRCEHCLAVCPAGAISVFNKNPQDSLPPVPAKMGEYMERLVSNRRSCRRFLDRNVDPETIDSILKAMCNVPTGGNAMEVEYSVIDDKDRVREIRDTAYQIMEEKAAAGIYTHSFSKFYYSVMKRSESTIRKDDMLFCGAPHLFIAHAKCTGKWGEDAKADCIIADSYFELLCNAHGLGTIIMSYSAEVLNELAPKARKMLNIPEDHYTGLIIGFGYPEIPYARGSQKERKGKIHRYSKDNG